jgi:uncharacterized membrane protein YdbT with pleckstrin-like domain
VVTAGEQVCIEERRHGVVLVGAFLRALVLAAPGVLGVVVGWPATIVGAALLAVAAAIVLRAVWAWERTLVVLTTEKLFVVHGTLRRRAAAVRLARVGPVEIEQSVLGRVLGYGTVVAGELEITHVSQPTRIVDHLR